MPDSQQNPCERSYHYQLHLLQRDEILKHKWIESEKAGYDVGFEWALIDWMIKHRHGWRMRILKEVDPNLKR